LNSNLSEWFKVTQKKPSLPANAAAAPRSTDQSKPQAAASKTGKGGSTKATFKANEFIVYPAHGVGVIKRIEKKLISGKEKSFYVLQVLENGMTIMVPTDNTAGVGLRALVSKQEVDEVMGILRDKKVKIDRTTWNRRYREYMEKIKTGSVKEIAEVLRNLYLLKNSKDLSFGEKKMFDTAKNLLVKEISMSNRIPEAEVEAELTKALGSA